MRKIVFISSSDSAGLAWGGSEELWSRTALYLAKNNVDVGVSYKWWDSPIPALEELRNAGCRIERRMPMSLMQRAVKNGIKRLWNRPSKKRDFAWIEQSKPDLVVLSQSRHLAGIEWMQACSDAGIPFVTLAQLAGECTWPDDNEGEMLRTLYEQATKNYFVSYRNLDLTRTQLASPLSHAEVIRQPFNVSYDAAPSWPDDDGFLRLACVARLEPPTKGQDLLLKVMAQEKWRKRPLKITFFGSGPHRKTLASLCVLYGLDNITFGGHVSHIEKIWATHNALVMPSRMEGMPLAMIEAMLCARPCIMTDVAGNAELIEDNRSGFVAAAPTVKLLDEAMERAWGRCAEWKHIGQIAARRVRELVPENPPAVFADKLIQLLMD